MSFYIDVKYLSLVSHRLPLFAAKGRDTWNCRCVVCGDSPTNKKKARGYFYRKKNDLFYKCHKCDDSVHFGTFLKRIDPTLYSQYVFERYASGENGPKAHTKIDNVMPFKFEAPVFKKNMESKFLKITQRLNTLPADHQAVSYCKNRAIPEKKFDELFYIEHASDIVQIAPQYKDSITSHEPRICFPFYYEGKLVGVTMRAIGPSNLRYIMVKFDEDAPSIFGMPNVDYTKKFYVVEGPIDSLFIDNAIACGGTSFGKLEHLHLPKDNMVVVIDNQPRNPTVANIMEKYVTLGYVVCIWPEDLLEKDINEMVLAGIDVQAMIDTCAVSGLMAKLKYSQWRKIK